MMLFSQKELSIKKILTKLTHKELSLNIKHDLNA